MRDSKSRAKEKCAKDVEKEVEGEGNERVCKDQKTSGEEQYRE